MTDEREAIRRWFDLAIAAVDPQKAVARSLERGPDCIAVEGVEMPTRGRVVIVAVGKAAMAMAAGAIEALGESIDSGFVLTKDGHANGELPSTFNVRQAGHPIPDTRGVAATRELLTQLSGLQPGDLAIALLSGGGSALLEAPKPPLTLDDVARTTELLLRAGAPIQDLNTVRIPLSEVKGGGLRRASRTDRMITLLLSDVLGNDPRVIASGPTVEPVVTPQDALDTLSRYEVTDRVPPAVMQVLNRSAADRTAWSFPDDLVRVVADNDLAVDAFAGAAQQEGRSTRVLWRQQFGEAAELGRAWVSEIERAGADVDVLVGGGEATVTVRGDGLGGRNTEFALAAADALEHRGLNRWTVASLATDGQDALTGYAGAVADAQTCIRAAAAGLDCAAALEDNDSATIFEAAEGVVETGPTGTNVNDLYVAVRQR